MMMCSQSGKPSGQPSSPPPVTLSSSSPWRWWRSTGTSSWRTTWTLLKLLNSSMVQKCHFMVVVFHLDIPEHLLQISLYHREDE